MFGYRYQIPPANNVPVDPQSFMNDIALLPINRSSAMAIRNQILMPARKRLISINTSRQLRFYLQPDCLIKIVVKRLEGQILANRSTARQLRMEGSSYYLLFTLNEG